MTDLQPPLQNAEHTLASGPAVPNDAVLSNGAFSAVDGPIEDDSTIKCICGFNDDDGNTVLCEDCNTWQHIECYYPNVILSDSDVHQCVNCKPRPIDAKAATERQKQTRFSTIAGDRKPKRAPTKSHKKKTRDSVSTIHLNGNSHPDKPGHDRTSGSPLEAPPAKRPKTSHRTSSSTTSINHPGQVNPPRRRTNSVAVNHASPTKSPPTVNGFPRPNERFSLEFMQIYDKEFTTTTTNSYSNLGTTDALSRWLDDSEEFEKVANGKTQHDVYMRWDSPWQQLEEMSPGVQFHKYEDETVTAHGRHPVFCYLTAERDAGKGAFLGELTGEIAIRSDYEKSSRMWPILKHPEPFVFFSDKLPICIDARNEGNKFRFIRRSCLPNSKMQIVIAGKEYRYCLVSDTAIQADDEITIPWYIDPKIMEILKASVDQIPISPEDYEYRTKWITGVLAHFGRCACNRPDDQCLLSLAKTPRFQTQETNGQHTKRKKGKKLATQISPLSTGRATNSRAGSEAVNRFDIDEDVADSPASGSAPSKPSSRDISPMVPGSEPSIGLGLDLSEREKRKIQEQERLFARLEQDGSRRKKRNSAGSTLNTPTASSSVGRPLAVVYSTSNRFNQKLLGQVDPFNPSPISASSIGKPRVNGRGHSEPKQRASQSSRLANSKPSALSLRTYSESATQTEGAAEEEQVDAQLVQQRRALGCSYAQRLLIRSRSVKPRGTSSSGSSASETPSRSPVLSVRVFSPVKMDVDSSSRPEPTKQMPPPPLPVHAAKENRRSTPPAPAPTLAKKTECEDVEMVDQPLEEVVKCKTPQPSLNTEDKESPPPPAQMKESVTSFEPHVESSLVNNVTEPSVSNNVTTSPGPMVENSSEELDTEPLVSPKPTLKVELPMELASAAQPVEITKTPISPLAVTESTTETTQNAPADPPETPILDRSPAMLKAVLNSAVTPALAETAAPSPPARKKMSLSDWSNRNKKKKIEAAQQAAQSSPLSTTAAVTVGSEETMVKTPEEDRKPELATDILVFPSVSNNVNGDAVSPIAAAEEPTPQAYNGSEAPEFEEPAANNFSDSSAMDIDPKPATSNASEIAVTTTV